MTTDPEPISTGVVLSGVVVLISAAALARALLKRHGRSHDDLAWPIAIPACALLIGLLGFALSVIPLTR